MNIIQNQEHIEARQEALNKRNEAFKATLTPEDQAKFDAVGQAMKILSEANVKVFIFPALKCHTHNEEVCYQYNNLGEKMEFDIAGKETLESIHARKKYITSLDGAIFYHLHPVLFLPKEPFDWEIFKHRVCTVFSNGSHFNKYGKFYPEI